MKEKLVVAVLASFASLASAQTISKGATLLEHKTWTTGGATGYVERNNVFFFISQRLADGVRPIKILWRVATTQSIFKTARK